jgi:hypothetical protein
VSIPVSTCYLSNRHARLPLNSEHQIAHPLSEWVVQPHVPVYGSRGGPTRFRPPRSRLPIRLGLPRRCQTLQIRYYVSEPRVLGKSGSFNAKRNTGRQPEVPTTNRRSTHGDCVVPNMVQRVAVTGPIFKPRT